MAGLGARLFPAFSKLTSSQVQGYLADQAIMRFASASARDAAFGGVGEPTLAEGMTCYLDDTNVLQSYNGTAWVSVAASQTTTNVSGGLVYVTSNTFSGSTGVELSNCFTSAYDNYFATITWYGSTSSNINTQYMTSTNTKDILATYNRNGFYWTSIIQNFNTTGGTNEFVGNHGSTVTDYSTASITYFRPFVNGVRSNSTVTSFSGDSGLTAHLSHSKATTTSYTGLYIFPTGGNITGTVAIYGFCKA